MPVKKVIFLSYSPVKTALEHLRVLGPLAHTEIQVINGIEGDKLNLDLVRSGDLVVFQRNFSSRYSAYRSVMNETHKHQIPVIMDLDDNLIGLPVDHPDRKWSPFAFELPALLHAMMNVDAITVTTPTLQSVIGQYNKNVFVLPNYLDDSIWNFVAKAPQDRQSPVTVAFVGTLTHQPDLNSIAEPLYELAEKYKEKISFLFYGPEIPDLLQGFGNIQHQPPVTYDYIEFARTIRTISADIAIAPLNDNLFNRCKSPIKYMEYTAMGLPCVYSNITPYSDVIRNGFNGYLADTANDWIEKLSELIDDQALRNQMLSNAQTDVQSNWMLHDHAFLWQNCFDQVLQNGVQEEHENQSQISALDQIAEQIEEQVQRQAEKTAILNQTIQETQAQIRLVKEESLREEIRAAEILQEEKRISQNQIAELNQTVQETQAQIRLVKEEALREEIRAAEILQEEKRFSQSQIAVLIEQNKVVSLHLENTKREFAEFLLSDSWRITRPLRKLSRIIKRGK